MAYIGSQPTVGLVTKLSDIASSFNGILTTFQLSIPPGGAGNSFTPGSVFQIIVSLGGVIQNPATDYTLSGSQITFTTAPAASLTCFIIALGQSINVGTPGAGTVTASSFGTLTSIPLTGATSGTTTIQAPAVAGNNTLTLPTSNGSANQFLKNGATAGSLGYSSLVEDSSGRVGLGSSAPSAKLEVEAVNFVGGPAIGVRYNTSNPRLGFNVANSNGFVYIGSNTNNKVSSDTPTYDLTGTAASQLRLDGGQLIFNNAPSGTAGNDISFTNCLTITSGGLVGIGTTSPGQKLDVADGDISITKTTGGDAPGVTSQSLRIKTQSGDLARLYSISSGSGGPSGFGGDLYIQTKNDNGALADRVFISRLGNVGIGTTSPANQLQLSTDSAGKPSSSLWTIVSDERIKEDIELADLDLCYEAIKAIPLKRYKWRDEIYTAEQVTDRRKLGWIAQDVETVFPKAVGTHDFKYNQVFEETIIPAVEEELDADGNVITPAQPERTEQGDLISEDVIEDCRDLNADQLYAAMYGAVQKLMAKVETLETSNADLLARVAALEAA